MELTAENVDFVVKDLLLGDGEADALGIGQEATVDQIIEHGLIVASCLTSTFVFSPTRVEEEKNNIRSMLDQLPDAFKQSSGGGWSFLNLCERADGVQWTGLHRTQEALCALAIATDLGGWLLPRDMWGVFPGGVPYFVYNDKE